MIVRNVNDSSVFENAALLIGVRVEVNQMHSRTFRVKVSPDRNLKDVDGNSPYQRESGSFSTNFGRKVHAVCWHGFRDFFRACFIKQKDLIFKTAFDTWNGSDDFENRYRESGSKNVGSSMYSIQACEVCRCPDSGEAK